MQMSKPLGYHAAHTNENKGYATHGKFKNNGQKKGKNGAIKAKPAKEALKPTKLDIHLKQLAKGMFGNKKHVENQGKQ